MRIEGDQISVVGSSTSSAPLSLGDRLAALAARAARRMRPLMSVASIVIFAGGLVGLGISTGRTATSASAAETGVDSSGSGAIALDGTEAVAAGVPSAEPGSTQSPSAEVPFVRLPAEASGDAALREYDGRPIRPAGTIRMRVTAYSPDARSCGKHADGITASGYSVWTNGGCLVAADPRVLPMGSLLSVPGYDAGAVVPVLDVGGAIKGARLDVLFPTHEEARRWGVRDLEVMVWEYADGKPAGFRRQRR